MIVSGDVGGRLLPLWSPASDKRSGYVPTAGRHPRGHLTPLISVELGDWEAEIHFPHVEPSSEGDEQREFSSLDDNTQRSLLEVVESGTFTKMDSYQREVNSGGWCLRRLLLIVFL